MAINFSNLSDYFKYPAKVAELRRRLYNYLTNKGVEVKSTDSLNYLIEKVKEIETILPDSPIYITDNGTYDVRSNTNAIVDVKAKIDLHEIDKIVNNTITSYTTPIDITTVGSYKFASCYDLSTADIKNVLGIGPYAFSNCYRLADAVIPKCKFIGSYAFYSCYALSSLYAPSLVSLGEYAFGNCYNLSSVSLADLRSLGNYTFLNCSALSSINLSDIMCWYTNPLGGTAVSQIYLSKLLSNYGTFANNMSRLVSIEIPTVSYFNFSQFSNLSELRTLSMPFTPSTYMYYNYYVIYNCPKLETLNLDTFSYCWSSLMYNAGISVLSLPMFTYQADNGTLVMNCSNLTSVSLPRLSAAPGMYNNNYGQTSGLFAECPKIKVINLPRLYSTYYTFAAKMSTLREIELPNISYIAAASSYSPFIKFCPELSILKLWGLSAVPNYFLYNSTNNYYSLANVQQIETPELRTTGSMAFYNCSKLSEFAAPLQTISSYTFYGCTHLSSLYLTGSTVATLSSYAFNNTPFTSSYLFDGEYKYGSIFVPSSLYESYITAANWAAFSQRITSIPDSYLQEHILPYEFYGLNIEQIPESRRQATSIYDNAFFNATIGEISMSACKYVGTAAFSANKAPVVNISLPEVSHIGSYAFAYNNINSIYLPKLSIINRYAFCGAKFSSGIADFPDVETIYDYAFNTASMTSINMPKVKTIEQYAFSQCYPLSSISLPVCEYIGYGAFSYLSSIKSLELPKVKYIDGYAFRDCYKVSQISLPKAQIIQFWAFGSNYSLSGTLSLPECSYLGTGAFYSCYRITAISAPVLKYLCDSALYSCPLETIYLPEVMYIGPNNFSRAKASMLDFPALLSTYGAFSYMYSLVSISVPKLTYCGDYTFTSCTSLQEISLPEAIYLGNGVFSGCSKLTSIYIPKVTTIPQYAFNGCWSLTTIPNLENISTINAYAFSGTKISNINAPLLERAENNAFANCYSLSQVSFPILSYLGAYAFQNCRDSLFTSVSFNRISTLCDYTFSGCSNLISINTPTVFSLATQGIFRDCKNLSTLHLMWNVISSIGSYMFYNCEKLDLNASLNYNIITYIGPSAFANCKLLSEIHPNLSIVYAGTYTGTGLTTVNNSAITSVQENAFASCLSLSEIILPNCNTVSANAFCFCPNLSDIQLPSGVTLTTSTSPIMRSTGITSIPDWYISWVSSNVCAYCFSNCSNLADIKEINPIVIGAGAFTNTALTTINLSNCTTLGTSAFFGNTKLTQVNLPAVSQINASTFESCSVLTTVNMPQVTSVGLAAFKNCSSLATVNFNSVSMLGSSAFENCTNLQAVNFVAGLSTIESNTFYGTGLSEISFGSGLRTIKQSAFNNCSILANVNFNNCATIENFAFQNCTSLSELQANYTSIIGDFAFENCTGLTKISVPALSRNYTRMFSGCTNVRELTLGYYDFYYGEWSHMQNLQQVNLLCTDMQNLPTISLINTWSSSCTINVPSTIVEKVRAYYGSAVDPERIQALDSIYDAEYIYAWQYMGSDMTSLISLINQSAKIVLSSAFNNCKNLTSLSLSNCKYCGYGAFNNCASLTTVNLPKMEFAGGYTFSNCRSLTNLQVSNLIEVPNRMLYCCYSLSELNLANCQRIDNYGLAECSVTSLTLSKISYLGYGAFYAARISTLNLPNLVSLRNNIEYSTNGSTFNSLYVSNFNAPELTYVQESTIFSQMYVSNLYMPKYSGSFHYTIWQPGAIVTLGGSSFYQNRLYVYSERIKEINLSNCTLLNNYAFNGWTTMTNCSLPKVTTVHDHAFYQCYNLSSIQLPMISYLSNYAFRSCYSLRTVVLGSPEQSSRLYMYSYCFSRTSSLDAIVLRCNQVPGINDYTFITSPVANSGVHYSTRYTSIYVPSSLIDQYRITAYWSNYSARLTTIEDHYSELKAMGITLSEYEYLI